MSARFSRVVSLVPSATETLVALGVEPVGVTRFCDHPGPGVVGGTKNPDIAAIRALAPDLVVVNDEENRFEDAQALVAAGIEIHSMSPRSVRDVGAEVRGLAERVGAPVPAPFGADEWDAWLASMLTPRWWDAFVAVWRTPLRRAQEWRDVGPAASRGPSGPARSAKSGTMWMSLAIDTYGASLLDLIGVGNVFADSLDRYPEVPLGEVVARAPNLVVLPDEPYAFGPRHVAELEREIPGVPVVLVDGRDLFWWGVRTPAAATRLRSVLPTR